MHENDQHNRDGGERELEAALRGLRPAATAGPLDPIACAFDAGRRAASQRANPWRATSAVLAIVLTVTVLNPRVIPPAVKSTPIVARLDPGPLSSASSSHAL